MVLLDILLVIINIFAFYKMINYYRKFCFENRIILSCIIQSLIVLVNIMTSIAFVFEFYYLVQITTSSYIIKRFIKLSLNDNQNSRHINAFFMINFLNFFIFILIILTFFYSPIQNFREIFELVYRGYSFSIFVVLAVCGYKVYSIIVKDEDDNKKDIIKLSKNIDIPKGRKKSWCTVKSDIPNSTTLKYYGIREKQIKTYVITSLICSLIQSIYYYFRFFYLSEHFTKEKENIIVKPSSLIGVIVYDIYVIFCFLSIFVYFLSFYWILRKEFEDVSEIISNNNYYAKLFSKSLSLSGEDIRMYSSIKSNQDIDKFFKKPDIERRRKITKSSFSEEGESNFNCTYDGNEALLKPDIDPTIDMSKKTNTNNNDAETSV